MYQPIILLCLSPQQGQVLTRNDPFQTVNQFCEWSRRRIPVGLAPHYDISVLITKERLGPSGDEPKLTYTIGKAMRAVCVAKVFCVLPRIFFGTGGVEDKYSNLQT